jgi:hypothetical protein
LLPRLVFPAFWLAWLTLLSARMARRKNPRLRPGLAIESGRIGWTHVFFEELLASALDYLGEADVEKVVINRECSYLPQFREFLRNTSCTHLVVDVRTGPQNWFRAVQASFVMVWLLTRRRITPIVVLADASLRRHRLQAAILTALDGVVVTFMAIDQVRPMFPHDRIIGPLPMPVSVDRLKWLEEIRARVPEHAPTVAFIGSVYPPREQFLSMLADLLSERGIHLRINADKYGTSNDDYWRVLATCDVIVTTTLQGMPRPSMDWIWIQQMVFRFSEALSAGAVLVAPAVEGVEAWFTPGANFSSFVSVKEACDEISALLLDTGRRESIRVAGHARAAAHVGNHAFWAAIDAHLGPEARLRSLIT